MRLQNRWLIIISLIIIPPAILSATGCNTAPTDNELRFVYRNAISNSGLYLMLHSIPNLVKPGGYLLSQHL